MSMPIRATNGGMGGGRKSASRGEQSKINMLRGVHGVPYECQEVIRQHSGLFRKVEKFVVYIDKLLESCSQEFHLSPSHSAFPGWDSGWDRFGETCLALTDTGIRGRLPPGRHTDGKGNGLALLVRENGAKFWTQRLKRSGKSPNSGMVAIPP